MLEELAEQRYKPVVNDRVFRLDFGHWTLYESSDQSFLENYRKALRSIGIYMSTPWIQRKLRQNHMKGGKLFWPNSDYLFSDLERWVSEFRNLNGQWLNEVAELRQELTRICVESYATMNTDRIDDTDLVRSQRRFRFAAHRLCSLGLPNALSELVADELVQNPWRVSAKLLCPGLAAANRADLLLKIMKESTHAYVRSVSAWSLGFVDFDTAGEFLDSVRHDLAELMFSEGSTFHEKLKTSEALLMLGTNEMIDIDQMVNLVYQEKNPYLKKNFLLLLHKVSQTETLRLLSQLTEDCQELIFGDAIQEVRRGHPELNYLPKADPALVQRYYSVYYPVSEVDDTISEAPSQEIL
ncbi:MAG: hypothetical protein M9936_13835 [Caldilinea sp.]|nr:hypothetical protein [Caldilinea sp.]